MNRLAKIITAILLLFNATGAIYGGLNLLIYPDGSSIQLSLDLLKHTPFHNYLIPGIILFVANGLFSLFVFIAILIKYQNYPLLVIAQGAVLTGWIMIQIVLIQTIYILHFILGGTGLALIILGLLCTAKHGRHSME